MGNLFDRMVDPEPQTPRYRYSHSTSQPCNWDWDHNTFRNVQNVDTNRHRISTQDNCSRMGSTSHDLDSNPFRNATNVDNNRHTISNTQDICSRMQNLNLRENPDNSNAVRSVSNLYTQSALCRRVIQSCSWPTRGTEYHLEILEKSSPEFVKIEKLFYKTTNKTNHSITKILRVENPYLKGRFQIKQIELRKRFGSVGIRLLFHGTNASNICGICQDNFDWRKHGAGTGHRFGQGVSFSPKSSYASNYSDKKKHDKVMVVAEVLTSRSCEGTGSMVLPEFCFTATGRIVRCDTSMKANGDVIVKYADDEFYPAYLIYFHAKYLNFHKKN